MAPTALLLVLVLAGPSAVPDEARAYSLDADPIGFLQVGDPVSLAEVWDIARPAVVESPTRVGRSEEYAVLRGTVLNAEMVHHDGLQPPLWPYARYSIHVDRIELIGTEPDASSDLDVVAMWPPRYREGIASGAHMAHGGRDLQVPLSVGYEVIAIGSRSREGRAHWAYRPELWPSFHVTFAVFKGPAGEWQLVMPEVYRRRYERSVAAAAGDSLPVPIEAWHGVTRRIEGSADEIFDLFVRAATDASEQ